jgi:MurNAc alpha-1-phosphate uridylyltransferase
VAAAADKLTFSGIAAYRREMFASISPGEKKPLAPLIQEQIRTGRVSGERYTGRWADIGTPERLAILNDLLAREAS